MLNAEKVKNSGSIKAVKFCKTKFPEIFNENRPEIKKVRRDDNEYTSVCPVCGDEFVYPAYTRSDVLSHIAEMHFQKLILDKYQEKISMFDGVCSLDGCNLKVAKWDKAATKWDKAAITFHMGVKHEKVFDFLRREQREHLNNATLPKLDDAIMVNIVSHIDTTSHINRKYSLAAQEVYAESLRTYTEASKPIVRKPRYHWDTTGTKTTKTKNRSSLKDRR